jgi:hypothetical protein
MKTKLLIIFLAASAALFAQRPQYPRTVTLTIAAGTYTYALETTDADGVIKPRMTGTIRIRPEPIV